MLGVNHPVHFGQRTSDGSVFWRVFVTAEYDSQFSEFFIMCIYVGLNAVKPRWRLNPGGGETRPTISALLRQLLGGGFPGSVRYLRRQPDPSTEVGRPLGIDGTHRTRPDGEGTRSYLWQICCGSQFIAAWLVAKTWVTQSGSPKARTSGLAVRRKSGNVGVHSKPILQHFE